MGLHVQGGLRVVASLSRARERKRHQDSDTTAIRINAVIKGKVLPRVLRGLHLLHASMMRLMLSSRCLSLRL
jgi:hypothetical protein